MFILDKEFENLAKLVENTISVTCEQCKYQEKCLKEGKIDYFLHSNDNEYKLSKVGKREYNHVCTFKRDEY